MSESKPWQPSKLNKILGALWCGALLRKGPMCCTTNCSCFNDVESPEASQAKADEARWKYRSEKLAHRQESRAQAAERREKRREHKKERKIAKADSRREKAKARSTRNSSSKSPIADPRPNEVKPPLSEKTPVMQPVSMEPVVQDDTAEKEPSSSLQDQDQDGTVDQQAAHTCSEVQSVSNSTSNPATRISSRSQAKAHKKSKERERRILKKEKRRERKDEKVKRKKQERDGS